MTDARYPERWLNDRRFLKLSDSAHRTMVTLLVWSASNRTDGQFDDDDVEFVPHAKVSDFAELHAAGLILPNGNGWFISVFEDTQTSAAQLAGLDQQRRSERNKKARQRHHKSGDHSLCTPSTCDVVPRDIPRDGSRDTKARTRTGRTGQASTERPPTARQSSVDDSFYGGSRKCPHGKPGGSEPDDFVGGNRASCPECAMEAAS